MSYFEKVLDSAIKKCDGYIDDYKNIFNRIYPYTTENVTEYINLFDFKDKRTLTVGSSSDQVISMGLNGALAPDVIDICPYTKFYFNLKKAGILTLNYNEFLEFFCYHNYPKNFIKNKKVFNKQSYYKLKDILRLLDYESFLFWDELFNNYDAITIRNRLFLDDEEKYDVIINIVPYLKDEETYNKAKKDILKVIPNFINENIFNYNFNKSYDNVLLSNICQYYDVLKLKDLMDKLNTNLNKNAKVLMAYLYQTKRGTMYNHNWASIYDLENTFKELNNYISHYKEIESVKGIKFSDNEIKDMLLIYKKIK